MICLVVNNEEAFILAHNAVVFKEVMPNFEHDEKVSIYKDVIYEYSSRR